MKIFRKSSRTSKPPTMNPYDITHLDKAEELRNTIANDLSEYGVVSIEGQITKIPSDFIMDNVIATVNPPLKYAEPSNIEVTWDRENDHLLYDGKRLKRKSGNPHDAATEETFRKIRAKIQEPRKEPSPNKKKVSKVVKLIVIVTLTCLIAFYLNAAAVVLPAVINDEPIQWPQSQAPIIALGAMMSMFVVKMTTAPSSSSSYHNKQKIYRYRREDFDRLFTSRAERNIFLNILKNATFDVHLRDIRKIGLAYNSPHSNHHAIPAVEFSALTQESKREVYLFDGINIYDYADSSSVNNNLRVVYATT